MNLFNRLTNKIVEWNTVQKEKKIERHREKGTCPDCAGRGLNPMVFSEAVLYDSTIYYCPSCNGSGSFSDWEEMNKQR